MCKWGKEAEKTLHHLLRYNSYKFYRKEPLNDIYAIDSSTKTYPEGKLLNNLLYVSLGFNNDRNQNILKQTIKYLIRSERFNSPLFTN